MHRQAIKSTTPEMTLFNLQRFVQLKQAVIMQSNKIKKVLKLKQALLHISFLSFKALLLYNTVQHEQLREAAINLLIARLCSDKRLISLNKLLHLESSNCLCTLHKQQPHDKGFLSSCSELSLTIAQLRWHLHLVLSPPQIEYDCPDQLGFEQIIKYQHDL